MNSYTPIPTPFEALLIVRKFFRTQDDMALEFGVTQGAVSRWLNDARQLPARYVLHAEALTGVSRHWLDPEMYPVESAPPPIFTGVDRRLRPVCQSGGPVSLRDSATGKHAA